MESRPPEVRRLFALIAPYKGRWALATLALVAGGATNLALPQAVRLAVDDAMAVGDRGSLDTTMTAAIAGFAILGLLAFARHYLVSWVGGRVVADLRERVFRHLVRHPPSFFHERQSGELVSRLTSDIDMLQNAVGNELSIGLRSALIIVGGLVILFLTSPTLSLAMIGIVPPVALAAVFLGRRIRKRSRAIQDELAQANRGLKEVVVGIDTVQSYQAEELEARRYGARVFEAFANGLKVALARGGFMGGAIFATYTAVAVILWLGSAKVIAGELSPGALASFLMYTLIVTGSMVSVAEIWANLQSALGASARIFELLDEEPRIQDPPGAEPLTTAEGRVAFEAVSFSYPSRPEIQVLAEVTFEAAPGEVVALVGHSGAGKSTIAALLQRFHDPSSGAIRVDGRDLRTLRLQDLRALVAPVTQEPMLFSGTVRDNILYGRRDASDDAMRQAARDAMIADFVQGLPDGYDTVVGERGVKLSGGERQRIAIARALLKNPRILVLDEATSHLDTENEALVHVALTRLMAGRTTLVIAHRLSTVQNANRILVLEQGRIVERGTHAELVARDSIYRRLTMNQAVLA